MSRVAQHVETVPVWPDRVPDADLWEGIGPELERPQWANNRLVRNVSRPTLTVFLPEPSVAVGTGVVLCPGGGFHFLMVDLEGSEVARWLNARGVAAFVLKYRLVVTPDDDEAFIRQASNLRERRAQMQSGATGSCCGWTPGRANRPPAGAPLGALSLTDLASWAFRRVARWQQRRPFGMTREVGRASPHNYAASHDAPAVPLDAPPLFLAAATDDPIVDASASVSLYSAWKEAGRSAELHLFAQGGHGFGLIQQGLPSDRWIDLFWKWLSTIRW